MENKSNQLTDDERIFLQWTEETYSEVVMMYINTSNVIEQLITTCIAKILVDDENAEKKIIEHLIYKLNVVAKAKALIGLSETLDKGLSNLLEIGVNEFLRIYKLRNMVAHASLYTTKSELKKLNPYKIAIKKTLDQPIYLDVIEIENDKICKNKLINQFRFYLRVIEKIKKIKAEGRRP